HVLACAFGYLLLDFVLLTSFINLLSSNLCFFYITVIAIKTLLATKGELYIRTIRATITKRILERSDEEKLVQYHLKCLIIKIINFLYLYYYYLKILPQDTLINFQLNWQALKSCQE
ncbi:hypothetical protein ACJX0J_017398, partial [Zea mays]